MLCWWLYTTALAVARMPTFRNAVVEQTTTVQVGYLTKPVAVGSVSHKEGIFIHVAMTLDWVCRAVTGKGRSTSPLKGSSMFLEALARITFGSNGKSTALAEGEVDPMEELLQEDVCAGGHLDESPDVVTPKKRSRKHLTQAELEFITCVPLVDVIDDIKLFEGPERDRVTQGSLRILIKTNRRRSVYVHEKDLHMCMLVLLRHVERMGVPFADLPEESSALADEPEWFDSRTSRWNLRVPDSEEIMTSEPVRRVDQDGKPLGAEVFKSRKAAVLTALKGKGKPQAGKGSE